MINLLRHTMHTMDLMQMTILSQTNDRKIISRFGYPVTDKIYKSFNKEFHTMFNRKELINVLDRARLVSTAFNRITMLESLMITTGKGDELIKQHYRDEYDQTWSGNFELLVMEITKLKDELTDQEITTGKPELFGDTVRWVSSTLGFPMPPNMKLSMFQYYLAEAERILEKAEMEANKE